MSSENEWDSAAAAVLQDLKDGADALSLSAARGHLSRDGHAQAFPAVHRTTATYARAINGNRVRLETAQGPSGLTTTKPAINRFFERLNGLGSVPPPQDLDRAHEKAARQLAAMGI